MLHRALEQSDKIILKRQPEWTNRYVKRDIEKRVQEQEEITEVWIQNENRTLELVHIKTEGWPFQWKNQPLLATNSGITRVIVNANVQLYL